MGLWVNNFCYLGGFVLHYHRDSLAKAMDGMRMTVAGRFIGAILTESVKRLLIHSFEYFTGNRSHAWRGLCIRNSFTCVDNLL